VHPLTSEVVDYLTQRTESMMAACFLLTLYAGVRALDVVSRRAWTAAAVIACACGMACKEPMATAPLMVALIDRVFVFDSWARALEGRRRLYAGLASTWIVLAALEPRRATTGRNLLDLLATRREKGPGNGFAFASLNERADDS